MIKAKYERQGDAMDRIVLSLLVDNTAGVQGWHHCSAVGDTTLKALP